MSQSEHEFLDYQKVEMQFISSFAWEPKENHSEEDYYDFTYNIFSKKLTYDEELKAKLKKNDGIWINPLIHERVIGHSNSGEEDGFSLSYQPTFAVKRRTLEYSGKFSQHKKDSKVYLVVPMELASDLLPDVLDEKLVSYINNRNNVEKEIFFYEGPELAVVEIELEWTIRIFDTGYGTITMMARCSQLRDISDRGFRYNIIHWMLHLSSNVDRHAESHRDLVEETPTIASPTDAFLWISNLSDAGCIERRKSIKQLSSTLGLTRISNLARFYLQKAIDQLPKVTPLESGDYQVCCFDGKEEENKEYLSLKIQINDKFFADVQEFDTDNGENSNHTYQEYLWDENQAPFILTSIELTPSSMNELEACVSEARSKEVASILAKLTLHNANVSAEFHHLNSDYLEHYLPTAPNGRLRNMCLDDRVYFTLSRRGALVISSSVNKGPASFVIPALLNLCEIIRTQLHSATSLSWELNQFTQKAANINLEGEDVGSLYIEYAKLRKRFLTNLQNPIFHLFDGGSVTEIAVAAEEALLIRSAWKQVESSFSAMDHLMRAMGSARLGKLHIK